jgi:cytoskeletal protein RodZ
MKTVGKQLLEARLARNWTPELAARETKIKVDRLRDPEADDYSHFTSPTYARGFVRTYARALGLDEYRILRQLDNKLPDDDSANIVTDSGVAYLPETAMPPRVAHRDYTGLYIVMGLGAVVTLAIVFVLFEAYRVGELSRWFASSPESVVTSATNAAPAIPATNAIARALPVDSNTPPPIVEATTATNAPAEAPPVAPATTAAPTAPSLTSPRALPVDSSVPGAGADTNTALVEAPKALPVDASESADAASATPNSPAQDATNAPPRALPVDPSDLTNAAAATMVALNGTNGVSNPPAPPVAPPAPSTTSTARQSNSGPVIEPSTGSAPAAPVAPDAAPQTTASAAADSNSDKRLVLTASQDSFVRVTDLDSSDTDKPLYAAVLHSGQSIGFDGHKFSINVGIPSAVDIKLDGVNYGPHSDQEAPETFTVQSHLP